MQDGRQIHKERHLKANGSVPDEALKRSSSAGAGQRGDDSR